MDLLIPEVGTIIWMLIAAGIVFFILVKWGFPMITRMVDERNEYIDKSLLAAKEANERLAGIQNECDELLKETRAEQSRILKEAADRRDEIIAEAEARAKENGDKLISDAREQIRLEKEEALRSLRRQVAEISVQVAERVVRKELSADDEQLSMIDRMIDDVKTGK
ncbi:MAG: F0F1 ATP synthase subunit B [Bacteroidaceae bacterium]|nr:F0F1 ATP synthase subunit B [Bacteroidaceae bacterium]MBO7588146.1 F0F1 ATP synthase subunit B [Bacteroidaceae bacterium]MBP5647334.1 F0F1 ATP synthase subunit B [Bacteroidaceae bacterium]